MHVLVKMGWPCRRFTVVACAVSRFGAVENRSSKASVTMIDSHVMRKPCVLMVPVVQLLKWKHSNDQICLSHHHLTLQTCQLSSLTQVECFKECTMTLIQVVDYLT